MQTIKKTVLALSLSCIAAVCGAENFQQTLVFIRHAEKPADGLGQITCQGLNRALALPQVLTSQYGKPDAIYAPDPAGKVNDHQQSYYYVRPLATIEPTAIRLGMPVNTPYGFLDINALESELTQDAYKNSLVFVAWEHVKLEQVVKNIIADQGGDASVVPHWKSSDFDSIYVIRISNNDGAKQVSFRQDQQNLNNLSTNCPQ
ncbi:histidine phosphatase family protein [Paraherbaspirillum soli]|uniref:Histidine phosphatase family protein n=1 Tax=Paraherbaspirillum soli TaxID=631222 RepID=A0ABW0M6R9_9BURK